MTLAIDSDNNDNNDNRDDDDDDECVIYEMQQKIKIKIYIISHS